MFDIFIIQKIVEEERRKRQEAERPMLEVPEPLPLWPDEPPKEEREERGVIIIGEDE